MTSRHAWVKPEPAWRLGLTKIPKGQRSLTVEHRRKLVGRFQVRPELFLA